MKKNKKLFIILGIALVLGGAAYNAGLAMNINGNCDTELKDVEALATEADDDEYVAWGDRHSCEGILCPRGGHYHECEVNGTGNADCTKGATTCTCGSNCNPCS